VSEVSRIQQLQKGAKRAQQTVAEPTSASQAYADLFAANAPSAIKTATFRDGEPFSSSSTLLIDEIVTSQRYRGAGLCGPSGDSKDAGARSGR
jgi:hypothetical protein